MAKFTKANELEVPQSVGPYTDGDIELNTELQVFEPHQGRDVGYKNPKWLAPTIFESYLRSESEKMSFNKGAEIRKYLFLKMKKLIPNDHNLKILLTINNIK